MKMTLKYGIKSAMALEKEMGKTSPEMLTGGIDPGDMFLGVRLIWAGLLHHDQTLTVEAVAEELDKKEGLYYEMIQKALKLYAASFRRIFGKELFEASAPEEEPKESENLDSKN